MMQNPFNAALQRGNVGKLNALYTGFATLRYYQKLLTPDKRYANTPKVMDRLVAKVNSIWISTVSLSLPIRICRKPYSIYPKR
jgi:hypothetical protein